MNEKGEFANVGLLLSDQKLLITLDQRMAAIGVNHGYKMYINHGEKCTLL